MGGKQKWRKAEERQIIKESLQLDNFVQSSPGMEITSWESRKHKLKKSQEIRVHFLLLLMLMSLF